MAKEFRDFESLENGEIVTVVKNVRFKKGKGFSFRFNYIDDKGKRQSHEKFEFDSVEEALKEREKFIVEYKNKQLENNSKDKTMNEVFDFFIEKRKNVFDWNTIKRYKSVYENHIRKNFGNQKINEINAYDITDYINSLKKTNRQQYVKSILKIFKALSLFAEERGFLEVNKIKVISITYKKEPEQQRVYSNEELQRMDDLFKDMTLYPSFVLGRYLGLRVGEVFGLMWSDIDWEKKTVSINKQMAKKDDEVPSKWVLKGVKTGSGYRTIDVPNNLLCMLKELKNKQESTNYRCKPDSIKLFDEDNNYIKTIKNPDFINLRKDGKNYNTDSVKILSRKADEIGLDYKSHNLRHTHASLLAAKGVDSTVLKNRMGHKKIETTLRYYIHETEDAKARFKNELDNILN